MNDDLLKSIYQEWVQAQKANDRRDCPAPEALAALVDRKGPEAERLARMNHVMSCAPCRREFEQLRALGRASGASHWTGRPAALAASIALLAVAGAVAWRLVAGSPGAEPLRGSGPISLIAPAPGTTLPREGRLTWNALAGATRYRVTLTGADGQAILDRTTADTTLALSLEEPAGTRVIWQVTALGESGTLARSTPQVFTIAGP